MFSQFGNLLCSRRQGYPAGPYQGGLGSQLNLEDGAVSGPACCKLCLPCVCASLTLNCCLGAGGGNWVIKSLLLLCQSGGSAILAQHWCRRELYTESDGQVQLKPLVSNFRCSMLHPSQAEKALLHNCMCISGPWRQRDLFFLPLQHTSGGLFALTARLDP